MEKIGPKENRGKGRKEEKSCLDGKMVKYTKGKKEEKKCCWKVKRRRNDEENKKSVEK